MPTGAVEKEAVDEVAADAPGGGSSRKRGEGGDGDGDDDGSSARRQVSGDAAAGRAGAQAPKAWPCGFYGGSIKNRRRPPVGK